MGYRLEITLQDIKSFYGKDNKFSFSKPINIIVGKNNSGKSNILYAISYFFIKAVEKTIPSLKVGREFMIFDKYSIPNHILSFSSIVTQGKKEGKTTVKISKEKDGKVITPNYLSGELTINAQGSDQLVSFNFDHSIDFIDFLLWSPQTISSLTQKLINKIAQLTNKIRGERAKGAFSTEITDMVSKNIMGIKDFDFQNQQIHDEYLEDFIDIKLTCAGFQKIMLLQYLCYLKKLKETYGLREWLALILIDEIENGLEFSRQRSISNQIIDYIKQNNLQENIQVLLTTHSPIIYSSFLKLSKKYPQMIDIFYVLRAPEGKSVIMNKNNAIDELLGEDLNRLIEMELGLSIYDLPSAVVFVEGNDKFYIEGVLEKHKIKDVKVYPVWGSPPEQIWDLIKDNLLSYTRKVILFFDEDKKEEMEEKIKKLKRHSINEIKSFYFGPKELEFFIYGEAEDNEKETKNIKDTIDKIKDRCQKDKKDAKIIEGVLRDLDNKGYQELKGAKELYKLLGKYYDTYLSEEKKRLLEKFIRELSIKE